MQTLKYCNHTGGRDAESLQSTAWPRLTSRRSAASISCSRRTRSWLGRLPSLLTYLATLGRPIRLLCQHDAHGACPTAIMPSRFARCLFRLKGARLCR